MFLAFSTTPQHPSKTPSTDLRGQIFCRPTFPAEWSKPPMITRRVEISKSQSKLYKTGPVPMAPPDIPLIERTPLRHMKLLQDRGLRLSGTIWRRRTRGRGQFGLRVQQIRPKVSWCYYSIHSFTWSYFENLMFLLRPLHSQNPNQRQLMVTLPFPCHKMLWLGHQAIFCSSDLCSAGRSFIQTYRFFCWGFGLVWCIEKNREERSTKICDFRKSQPSLLGSHTPFALEPWVFRVFCPRNGG